MILQEWNKTTVVLTQHDVARPVLHTQSQHRTQFHVGIERMSRKLDPHAEHFLELSKCPQKKSFSLSLKVEFWKYTNKIWHICIHSNDVLFYFLVEIFFNLYSTQTVCLFTPLYTQTSPCVRVICGMSEPTAMLAMIQKNLISWSQLTKVT